MNATDLFKKCTRVDIIFKYLYVKHRGSDTFEFYKSKYLESIKWFNNFYELEPRKCSSEDFISHFDNAITSIQSKGFVNTISQITFSNNLNVFDGAHRFSICAAMGLKIDPIFINEVANFNFAYFIKHGMPEHLLDFAATNTAIENSNTYVVNVHSCVNENLDNIIDSIISDKSDIYYKKLIPLTFNGYVNLKKITYDRTMSGRTWVGNSNNNFEGAFKHASASYGNWASRAYLIIANELDDVLEIKRQIRALCANGNYSVHITDDHEEAIDLANYLFNQNSIRFLNLLPYKYDPRNFLDRLFANKIKKYRHDKNFVISGSIVLELFGLRSANDIDYLSTYSSKHLLSTEAHDDQLDYYPIDKFHLIYDNLYYFYFAGYKILTLDVILSMKSKRAEFPKDINDIALIYQFIYQNYTTTNVNEINFIDPHKNKKGLYITAKGFIKKLINR